MTINGSDYYCLIQRLLAETNAKDIGELINILKTFPPEEIDGELNYVVTKILNEIYPLRDFHINKAIGVLECNKLEYYRRVVAPYEGLEIEEAGNV